MISRAEKTVLQLISKAVDASYYVELKSDTNWEEVLRLASEQGVHGVIFEAIDTLPARTIPQQMLLQWIGVSEIQRNQYEQAWYVACKLDKIWAAEGIHATVLKGRSIAKFYPVPHHRYSCDLDVFIGEGWGCACELLEERGVRLIREVYKEAEFTLDNIYVECHRYITPLRGNKQLTKFEHYLRLLLDSEPKECFEETTLVCPPLMFTVMLYLEHALGDFLHGHLLLKHIVDWVILRRQNFNRKEFISRCKEFKFDRFLSLIDALADVVEGVADYDSLSCSYQSAFDDVFKKTQPKRAHSWFQRRINLLFDIVKNEKRFRDYGYTSMPSFLFSSVWSHFFTKEVKL